MELRVLNARRALESTYGLALEAVTDSELERALAVAFPPGAEDYSDRAALDRFVDLLPIDESSLFRNESLWTWISGRLLPTLLDGAAAAMRPLRAASLGCAGGQEAFSLAMLILRELRQRGVPASAATAFASIWGVDASPARVELARSGSLTSWSVQRARADWVDGMVEEDPREPGRFKVHPAALALTRFEQKNLMELVESPGSLAGLQLVFLQHVLVYFREQTAEELLQRLAASADPDTVLIVSPVESHLLDRLRFVRRTEYVGAVTVVRRDAPSPPPPAPARASAPAPAAPQPPPGPRTAEAYVQESLELLAARRYEEALRAARAATYADPANLHARLCMGQILLRVDPARGRRVLEELSAELARLGPGAREAPAGELAVDQLRQAVELLLARPRG